MKYITIFLILLIFVSCENQSVRGIKNANDETPIRYVICSQGGTNCFVAARFKDLDGCEDHKYWADMLCDKFSTPGKMICTQDKYPKLGVAYCTL